MTGGNRCVILRCVASCLVECNVSYQCRPAPPPQVVGLELGSNNLIGPVPAASCLEQLVHLQQLYLNSNLLTGPIPTELGKLENLRFL